VTDDNGGVSLPATVFVRVNRPSATDVLVRASGTTATTINVLANDSDPDGNQHVLPHSVKIVSNPSHGTVSVLSNGQVV
jgi:hypothetical protein